jgi:hypothetical protein
MRLMKTTAVGGLLFAIAGSASGQTVKAVSDNRAGTVIAASGPDSVAKASYVVGPPFSFLPVAFNESVTKGGAYASLLTQSDWYGFTAGGTSAAFEAIGSLDASLGIGVGTAIATDSFDVQFKISGLGADETVQHSFVGVVTSTSSLAEVTLSGPGVDLSYGNDAEWNQVVGLGNGTYTLTMDVTSSLVGAGPASAALDYLVRLDRVPLPGDMCDEAIPIPPGVTVVSTVGMRGQSQLAQGCNEGFGVDISHDAFFTYDATASEIVTIHTCSPETTFDTRLAVYAGTCDDPVMIACNDDAPGCNVSSQVTIEAVAGQRYLIQLGSYDGSTGTAAITISPTENGNDTCDHAMPIGEGTTIVSTIGKMGDTTLPPTCAEAVFDQAIIHNDAWFAYVATETGTATVMTCGPGATFDTRLAVYAGTCADVTLLGCSDDWCGSGSLVTFATVRGETYLIELGAYLDTTGQAALTVAQAPANDECSQAAPITVGTTHVSTFGATGSSFLPGGCNEGAGVAILNDVFFSYVATADGVVTVYTCSPNTTFDTRLAAYEGSCGTLTLLACNDDWDVCGTSSIVTFEAVCGTEYLIQLGSKFGSVGEVDLSVSQFGSCPPPCIADLDGDGTVGGADMATLLGQWGGTGSGDLDSDGTVDAADLATLLGAWGACP